MADEEKQAVPNAQEGQSPTGEQPSAPGTAPEQPKAGDKPADKTFTQADVDRILDERLKRDRAATLNKIGFASVDDAKKAADQIKAMEDAKKSAEEKLQEQLKTAEQRAIQSEERYRSTLIRAATIEEAGKQGVTADRYAAAYKLLDSSKLIVNEHGDVEGIADAVRELLIANPFLKADLPKQEEKPKGTVQPTNPGGGQQNPANLDWYKFAQRSTSPFGQGIVIPPSGEK